MLIEANIELDARLFGELFLLFCSDQEAEDSLRRELSRHLRYCLQSSPMNVSQLQSLWFLLSSDRVSSKGQEFPTAL